MFVGIIFFLTPRLCVYGELICKIFYCSTDHLSHSRVSAERERRQCDISHGLDLVIDRRKEESTDDHET